MLKGKEATEDEGAMQDVVAPNTPSIVKASISLPSIMLRELPIYDDDDKDEALGEELSQYSVTIVGKYEL